ncbi:MAG: DUF2891 family protein [Polyangiales bacterium]
MASEALVPDARGHSRADRVRAGPRHRRRAPRRPLARGRGQARALDFFADDRDYPLHLEPGGEDFLSPSLASADLLRRVLAPSELAAWLDRTMPFGFALPPVTVTDPTDGRLAHLDGLNLSRAWMLEGLASGLPSDDPRVPTLLQSARAHGASALAAIDGAHYAGSHWLGTFACYWLTKRGLP